MAKKSKRTKQVKRRAQKRAAKQVVAADNSADSSADRLLARIHREARARREANVRLLQLEEERAWRAEQLRRARGLDDWDEDA